MRALNFSDLFSAVRVIDNSGLRTEVTGLVADIASGKTDISDLQKVGIVGILNAIGVMARPETEKALMEFLALPFEMTPAEVGLLELDKLMDNLEALANDPGTRSFFKRLSGILGLS